MLEPLYTAEEMRSAEERYPGYPDTVPELMERAGAAVAREAMRCLPVRPSLRVRLWRGIERRRRPDRRARPQRGRVEADETSEVEGYDVIVDALFGTGFHGEPRADAAALIQRINATEAAVVSVDLPSGVDASTGEAFTRAAVWADLTVTFHGQKVGLVVMPGRLYAGRAVVVADIGLEAVTTEHGRATLRLLELVPRRAAGDTKYTAGSVLVVGGQPGMTGAVCLSALAALRADAGYVDARGARPSRCRSSSHSCSNR